jgi:hypothetical protein
MPRGPVLANLLPNAAGSQIAYQNWCAEDRDKKGDPTRD